MRDILIDLGGLGRADVLRPRADESLRPVTRTEADRVLRGAGYQRVGCGGYSAVYRKAGQPFVLKVFSTRDHAYRDFLLLARAHAGNPHFPRIVGKVVPVTSTYSAVRMEPLAPYRHDPAAIDDYMRLRDFEAAPGGPASLQKADALDLMETLPALREACDLIIDMLLPQYERDIKPENVMLRGSTIVLIDPVKDPSYDGQEDLLPDVDPPAIPPRRPAFDADDDDLLRSLFTP